MGDSHGMIVHHIGKIIGGVAVRLDQNHIVKLRIVHRDISVQFVMEGSAPLSGIVLADDEGLPCRQIRLYLLFAQRQTVLVINGDFLSLHHLRLQGRQSFLVTEAIVGLPLLHELFGILHVNSGFHPFALHIRPVSAVLVRPLVVLQPHPLKGAVDDLRSPLHESLLIRVLDTEHKVAALMLCD